MARKELLLILVLGCALLFVTFFSQASSNLASFQQVVCSTVVNKNENHLSKSQRVPIENVSWIGRQYFFPEPYRIYRPNEFQDFFGKYPTLWIGDSTMRRAFLTLHLLMKGQVDMLDVEGSGYLNVNKKWNSSDHNWQDEYCDRYTNESTYPVNHGMVTCRELGSVHSDFVGEPCLTPFLALAQRNPQLFTNYRIIVLSYGLHDLLGMCPDTIFRDANMYRAERIIARRQFVLKQVPILLDLLLKVLPENAVIAWRTIGFHTKAGNNQEILIINEGIRQLILTNYSGTRVRLVDWGKAVYPRSVGDQRIVGDNHYHYGHEARLLFLQMLLNTLAEELE